MEVIGNTALLPGNLIIIIPVQVEPPLNMGRAFIAAESVLRWPNAHFTRINNQTRVAGINVKTAGTYSLRLARMDGSMAAILSDGIILAPGNHQFDIAASATLRL